MCIIYVCMYMYIHRDLCLNNSQFVEFMYFNTRSIHNKLHELQLHIYRQITLAL